MKLILLVFGILAATNQEVRAAELIGRVTDTDTGAPLQGVNLQIQGLPVADQTDTDGRYSIESLESGVYTLTASHIGYASITKQIRATHSAVHLNLSMKMITLPGQSVTVTATRAIERETPLTFSNLGRKELTARFHTQGIPTLLSELPSSTTYSETGNDVGYTYLTMRRRSATVHLLIVNNIIENNVIVTWTV